MALNKLENVNPLLPQKKKRTNEKKNQKCGRDLANFYFRVRVCSYAKARAVERFTHQMEVLGFHSVPCFPHFAIDFFFFWQFLPKPRAFDDTKHLIICYVTVLRTRIFEWHDGWDRIHSLNLRTHTQRKTHTHTFDAHTHTHTLE